MKKRRIIKEEIGTSLSENIKSLIFVDLGSFLTGKAGSLIVMLPDVGTQTILKWAKFVHRTPIYKEKQKELEAISARFSGNNVLNSVYSAINKLKSKEVASPEENKQRESTIARLLGKAGRFIQNKLTENEKEIFAKISPDLRSLAIMTINSINQKLGSTTQVPSEEEPESQEQPEQPEQSVEPTSDKGNQEPDVAPEKTPEKAPEKTTVAKTKEVPADDAAEVPVTKKKEVPIAKKAPVKAVEKKPEPVPEPSTDGEDDETTEENINLKEVRKVTDAISSAFMNKTPKKMGNTETDGKVLKLHGNEIAKWKDDKLFITSAGWPTVTTKERLNGLPGVSIQSKNFQWYLNGKVWDQPRIWTEIPNVKPNMSTEQKITNNKSLKLEKIISRVESLLIKELQLKIKTNKSKKK